MLVYQGEGSSTPTESYHTPSHEVSSPSHTTHTAPSLPPITTTFIPTFTPTKTTPIRQYTRRARIAQSSALPTIVDEPASPQRDVSQGEACPTDSGFIADQDRATIAKSPTLPHESTSRVTSFAVDEGSLKLCFQELMDFCTSLQRQQTDKEKVSTFLEMMPQSKGGDKEKVATERVSSDTEEIRLDEWEVAAEKEMATVLITIDVASVLSSGGVQVVPTAAAVAPANEKGKKKMVETHTPKKKKRLQEQIDIQFTRELEEELEREAQRMNVQISKDEEIAKIHAEEELQQMIEGLDRSNETIAKHLEEYEQASAELTIGERIELISELVKYQDHHSKILQYQAQQRKTRTKKQKRDFYMAVIKNNLGWKVKDLKGMSFEEVEAKFKTVWKQMEDFIPMGSKEEGERIKRKGLNLEQESAKKQKTSEEVPEEVQSFDEVPEEKIKELIQLVPIEEVYVEVLQVKHPIIDWKVHTKGQRNYWKITRLGGSLASHQFFVDMLKQIDREDLNQLWALVKETLSVRPASNEKEMEL
nr:hypothetical protein [Tanacetum cinerariifolium]